MVPWASAKAARTPKIQSDLAPGAQPPCGCLWQDETDVPAHRILCIGVGPVASLGF